MADRKALTKGEADTDQARLVRQRAALDLVRSVKEQGLELTGPDGLLKQFTARVSEAALDEEMSERLGRAKHEETVGGAAEDPRNGVIRKTVTTDAVGKADISVPRDRDGSFEPVIVKKRQRRLTHVDEMIPSLYAKGLTTGEISARFHEVYGVGVSKETISRITDRVVEEMNEWTSRPLNTVYAAIFIDAIVIKVRDGQVANRAFYAAIGVDLDGNRDVPGLWGSSGGEGAKYWLSVLADLKNRGVNDTFFLICDGPKGLPEAVEIVWPQAIVQTCVIHLMRNTFNYASTKDWDGLRRDVEPIYTATAVEAAEHARDSMPKKRAGKYPAIRSLWLDAWERFTPLLDYDPEIRRVICSTNAIESLNARFRRSIRARGHFPSEQAALKRLYLTVRSLDPTGKGRVRWVTRWKPALNAFAITFADRWPNN
jgi:transposase-like protein